MYNRVGSFVGKEVEVYDKENGEIYHSGIVLGATHDVSNPIVAEYDGIIVRASEALHFNWNGYPAIVYITEGMDIREVKSC